jgi:hypothetical protein
MTKIKYIETKEEWIKLILDGAKGVSNWTNEYNYVVWTKSEFVYKNGTPVAINLHTKDFGIIVEVEEVELFEYMYKHKDKFETWYTYNGLYTEKEAEAEFKHYEYKKTGRSFKVQKD